MSAAASAHELEELKEGLETSAVQGEALDQEREVVDRLVPPTAPGPLIALDLDDVLSQTNQAVADWHNDIYGTQMKVSDFLYRIYNTKPVPGAREGIESLRQLGFRLIIVTARSEDNADESWKWVERHFPGCFESIICTGQFTDAHKKGHEVVTKLSKAQVCDDLKAVLLIDDSAENAVQCVTAERPVQTLLFGDYEWNKRLSGPGDARDEMAYDVRLEREGGRRFWEEESVPIPEGAPLHRVRDWGEAIRWIRARKDEGKWQ
ncbi:hypothetical protein MD484_g1118, partial [Candolleomyces efflorescens]